MQVGEGIVDMVIGYSARVIQIVARRRDSKGVGGGGGRRKGCGIETAGTGGGDINYGGNTAWLGGATGTVERVGASVRAGGGDNCSSGIGGGEGGSWPVPYSRWLFFSDPFKIQSYLLENLAPVRLDQPPNTEPTQLPVTGIHFRVQKSMATVDILLSSYPNQPLQLPWTPINWDVAESPLWPGCEEYSELSAFSELLNIKSESNLSERHFNQFLKAFGQMLPKGHKLPDSFYSSKKVVAPLVTMRTRGRGGRLLSNKNRDDTFLRLLMEDMNHQTSTNSDSHCDTDEEHETSDDVNYHDCSPPDIETPLDVEKHEPKNSNNKDEIERDEEGREILIISGKCAQFAVKQRTGRCPAPSWVFFSNLGAVQHPIRSKTTNWALSNAQLAIFQRTRRYPAPNWRTGCWTAPSWVFLSEMGAGQRTNNELGAVQCPV
ncbi:hypothetical protein KSP39_PZI023538 [Platanthera zijinensis]|uniref:Uncharacterized protein n=1 Tax=Platanthera zijinensis TaxID=2320716 RepID=A0AAP0ASR6_9ASPA